jgi:hypothetical protein
MGQGPDLNLENFEGIKNGHRNGVGSLVCEMTPNASSDALVGLPHVDRLTIIVEECVDAPTKVSDRHLNAAAPFEGRVEEERKILPKILSFERREIHRIRIATEE